MTDFSALVLAAGGSRRLGRPKQTLKWGGETLLQRAVRLAGHAGAVQVYLVLGCHAESLQQATNATVIFNPYWRDGLGASVAVGANAVDDRHGLLVLLCDQPLVDEQDLKRLVSAWRQMPSQPAAACGDGYLGVPALFPPGALPDLRQLTGHRGARQILTTGQVTRVDLPHAASDVDTENDWQRLKSMKGITP